MGDDGYNFMKKLLKSESILMRRPEVFLESYIPPRILGRDRQLEELAFYLKYVTRGVQHPHIIIHGRPGVGKSVVVRYALKGVSEFLDREVSDTSYKYSYVLCRDHRSEGKILEKIIGDITGEEVSFVGHSISKHYKELKNAVEEFGGTVTIVLDEANLMTRPNDVLYNLSRFSVDRGGISIICITNSATFLDNLESSVLSSLSPARIVFPSYTSPELELILKDRAREGLYPDVLEDGVIQYCAAVGAHEDGDARRAIALLKLAVMIAEREKSDIVTVEHAKKALKELEKDVIGQTVIKLPPHEKIVLLSIASLSKVLSEVYGQKDVKVTTGQIYGMYQSICRSIGVSPLTLRRVGDFIRTLSELELIDTVKVHRGRYGLTRTVVLGGKPEYYIQTILEDQRFSFLTIDELHNMAANFRK
ncbi:Cdc6/Cdc18 family protein [Archaeoglobus neptunius]|uniref:Cdc6/Cdc18 family protein n=1 Tax=Archaeoglobus neptunius TaxID=2798580 RepID=UPI001928C478|nr:AAA family ATPase [Archaeoglobus neptunius]